ncbi:EAL domain-containing protein [Amnibacterium sp.]|uniref:sensor domain-containing protein n=1 Tax=Amnibacterium sp. TaxID=1872496 RepID=UPI0026124C69|nr:EAL domain-containing protein [Amnibacterium sp.]MCU1473553.1 sensor-containing diguanylate cyclase/phosphodiesterase [Amnibacterium sp.]
MPASRSAITLPDRAFDALPAAAVVTDATGIVLFSNQAFSAMTGRTPADVVGRPFALLTGPAEGSGPLATIRRCFADGGACNELVRQHRRNGEAFWTRTIVWPLRDGDVLTRFAVIQTDVTGVVRARELLDRVEQQRTTDRLLLHLAQSLTRETELQAVLQGVADAICEVSGADAAAVAEWAPDANNMAMLAVAGWGARIEDARTYRSSPQQSPELEHIVSRRQPVLRTLDTASGFMRRTLAHFGIHTLVGIPMPSDGELPGLLLACWSSAPDPGRLERATEGLSELAAIATIALQNARMLEQVRQAASIDALTRLPNRTVLTDRLGEELGRSTADSKTAVVYCDIDRFKRTNDLLGHRMGDRVLQEVAARLVAAARPDDLVARVGGDEFVVLVPRVHSSLEVDALVRRVETAFAEPLSIEGVPVRVALSLGTATSGRVNRASRATTAEALLHTADSAMYWRKARRGGRPGSVAMPPEQRIRTELPEAARRGLIHPYWQPQLDLRTDRVVALEALAHWDHPELGLLTAARFIPVAESTGDIIELGRHMLRASCRFGADLRRHRPGLTISVNVSSAELASPTFADGVLDELAAARLPPEALTLELTETQLAPDENLLAEQAVRLSELGVHIALDDFGTGYTAISQLQNLPISELKLDRYFVQREASEGADLAAAIVALGHGLQLRVVAEGAETPEQLARVRRIGADRAQGFLISRPLPPGAVEAYLDSAWR